MAPPDFSQLQQTDNPKGNEVNHEDGGFQEYITVKGDIQIKIPDNLSFEEASTLGVGVST